MAKVAAGLSTKMREAFRLIKNGDLAGATAAIQGGLARAPDARQTDSPLHALFKGWSPHPVHTPAADEALPTGARFLEANYSDHAGSRRYKLYIPAGFDGGTWPLVVMLHGCKQSPDDFALGTGMNRLAEQHRFLVLYPAQSQRANGSNCWNWFRASDQQRNRGEPAIIAGMTRHVIQTHALDASRVYVAGLSAGGAMAVVMARTYPDIYAAAGVHSGLPYGIAHDVPSAFAAMEGRHQPHPRGAALKSEARVPLIVFHGDSDKTVAPLNASRVSAQSLADAAGEAKTSTTSGDAGRPYTRKVMRDAAGTVLVEEWTVHGAGHAWFGGNPRGSYTDPRAPDASGEMARFFLGIARK